MRFLFRQILRLILLSPLVLATSAWFALGDTPRVAAQRQLSHEDIARARTIIKRNDPSQLPAGSRQTMQVSQTDLSLVASYLLRRVGGAASVEIHDGSADLIGTARIPKLPIRPYLNVYLTVEDTDGAPQLRGLRLGQVPIPDFLTGLLVRLALGQVYDTPQVQLAEQVVQDLDLKSGLAAITYVWQPDLIGRARDSLLGGTTREALAAYHNHLAALHARGVARSGSVVSALQALFAEAKQRSRVSDPVDENRALLLVLGAWVNGRGMDKLVPQDRRQGRLRPYRLSLAGRSDFGQHFLTSAALVSAGDTALSDAIGLYKEVKGGSGFSFTDLAADRAGTRFGELATASAEQARWVQKRLAARIRETEIMPRVHDLPEHMGQAEFERRFGSVGSARYNQITDEIERRLGACRLYLGA